MFLRNAWYPAATVDELAAGQLFPRIVLNEPIVLFRDAGTGKVAALEDRCCHRGAPLSIGQITDRGLVCGYHGLVFDARGICIDMPGSHGRIPESARVRSYPVSETGGFVWIWMGDPAGADEDLIPSLPRHGDIDDRTARRAHGVMHVKANYVLFLENLMDLTHLPFVHKTSIGGHPEDHADAQMETHDTPNGVHFSRLMLDAVPPPGYAKRYGFAGKIDRWEEFDYVAPATVLQFTGAVDAGDYKKGIRSGHHHLRGIHTFLPETERSCFYFWSFVDGFRGPGSEADRTLEVAAIFREDAKLIEQQQLRLEGYDLERLTAIPSDVARVHMGRFLARRIAEERDEA
ncbi:MAG TPA: aromatic ring-hydroxylating dioxygenase subunit alpha [Stellaceae bacterium]|nr:aromatic ring-hydroxylating dioxygenase subunit alpha [Stellaceae bacterium]